MLRFYEDGPDAAVCLQHLTGDRTGRTQAIDPLQQHASHAFLPYLPVPRTAIPSAAPQEPSLEIRNASTWTYSGPLLVPNSSALPPSFHIWASATTPSSSTLLDRLLPFLSFLQTFLSAAGAYHYWLTIRATKSTNEYNTPRWHTDDNFFSNDPEADGMRFSQKSTSRNWKLATTLLGPSTLFLKNNPEALKTLRQTKSSEKKKMGDHTCASIRCLGCSSYADSVRQSLHVALASFAIESPEFGQVAFFRIGEEEGAVHSEPKCNTDRIFVNVIPGTQENLRNLMGRWGMGFPRAWCFGVPVGFVPSDERESFVEATEESAPVGVTGQLKEPMRLVAVSPSLMSAKRGKETASWLGDKGFRSAEIFGHAWPLS